MGKHPFFRISIVQFVHWLVLLLVFAPFSYLQAKELPGPLVDTKWLSENLDRVVVLDVRKDVESFEKRPKGSAVVNPCGPGAKKGSKPLVVAGHIPGAVLVPWKEILGSRKIGGVDVKVLLPEKGKFENLMQKSGVNNDSVIVITSKGGEPVNAAMAARLYLTLKYFSHDDVALLDGGTAQWLVDKQRVKFGKSKSDKGNFEARGERTELIATMDEVLDLGKDGGDGEQLLDVRGKDLYLGLTRTGKFVPPEGKGHIPGAKNFPVAFMVNMSGPAATFYDEALIKQVSDLVGIDTSKPTTTYCDTGVFASLGWFALHELIGNPKVRVYDGSMHEWSKIGKPVVAMKIE